MSLPKNIENVVHLMTPIPTLFLYGTAKEIEQMLDEVPAFPIVALVDWTGKPGLERSGGTSQDYSITVQFLTTFEAFGDSFRGINADIRQGGFKSSQDTVAAMMGQMVSFLIALRKYTYSDDPTASNYKAGYGGAPVFKPNVKRKGKEKPVINRYGENIFGVELTYDIETFYPTGWC